MEANNLKPIGLQTPTEVPSQNSVKMAQSLCPVDRDSPDYNMKHPHRGKAYIFNQENFDQSLRLSVREGSCIDVANLEKALSHLDFEVFHLKDYDITSVRNEIKQLAKEDHAEHDCVMVIVLSHGKKGEIYASDSLYHPDELWLPFTSEECPTLAGKPKLFIIQACQGEQKDPGTMVEFDTGRMDSVPHEYSIPTLADFMMAYSTIPGYVSWRNPQTGTRFIEALCQLLMKHGRQEDLLSMMTMVQQKVATHSGNYSQIPCVVSQLIRRVYFPAKE